MSAMGKAWVKPDYSQLELIMLEFKVWDLNGVGCVQSTAIYRGEGGEIVRRNIGAALDDQAIIAEHPIPSMVYHTGKLIRDSWRELSSPKE